MVSKNFCSFEKNFGSFELPEPDSARGWEEEDRFSSPPPGFPVKPEKYKRLLDSPVGAHPPRSLGGDETSGNPREVLSDANTLVEKDHGAARGGAPFRCSTSPTSRKIGSATSAMAMLH